MTRHESDLFTVQPEIINNGQAAFARLLSYDPWLMEIFLYDNGRIVRITDGPPGTDNRAPDIRDDGAITWMRELPGETSRIALYQDGQIDILTDPEILDSDPAFLPGGRIIFSRWFSSQEAELFVYEGGSIVQITDNGLENQSARTNSNGDFVWTRYDPSQSPWLGTIMLSLDGKFIELTDGDNQSQGVDINDLGYVALIDNPDLYLWIDGERTLIAREDRLPRINNNGDIAFLQWNGEPTEAMLYRDGIYYQLSAPEVDNSTMAMNDRGEVAWFVGDFPNLDLMLLWEIRAQGDFDNDNDVDPFDFESFLNCFSGPDPEVFVLGTCISVFDADDDGDIDFADFGLFQQNFTESE